MLDENLRISAIQRNGTAEAFDRLSDGTQEQLAVARQALHVFEGYALFEQSGQGHGMDFWTVR